MNNPFLLALRTNPDQFLKGLQVSEIEALMVGCVGMLEKRAKSGDRKAALSLQVIYRQIGAVEI